MPYIDFGNTPVKESIQQPKVFTCGNCIHNVFIPGGCFRCSITNRYSYYNNYYIGIDCSNKDEDYSTRKSIVGLFIVDDNGIPNWTGMITFGNINGINDSQAFKEMIKIAEENIAIKAPQYKDAALVHCIIAESRNNNPFVNKTNLISKNIVDEIIDDANKKFL